MWLNFLFFLEFFVLLKLHFSSSLRALCSPHHEGNMPAPFIVVTNRTKKCFLKMLWENPFLESCYKSGELSSYQLQDIQRHQELSQTIIPTGAVVITCTVGHCRMSSLWKPYRLTFTTTKAPTEFCKYHRNIFNFALLSCSRGAENRMIIDPSQFFLTWMANVKLKNILSKAKMI